LDSLTPKGVLYETKCPIVDAMTPEALFEGIKTLLDHPEMQQKFIDNLTHETYDNSSKLQKLYNFLES